MKQSTTKSRLRHPEETRELGLNVPDDIIVKLALDAHKRDVSLNTHIIDVLKKGIKNTEEYKFENGSSPEFLTED
jgi:predicted HicB family RNase H-like nuclease